MADIFISYSSKDREQAEQLTELLASAGLSVWIDKHGIGAATSWSGEISKAIEECKALVLLLSEMSIQSDNVRKEVSLAAERKKKILPLDLEPVALPHDLAYHLAGIQRTSVTNIDSIIRALGNLGLEATQAPTMKIVKETDSRKSLMILPFDDLSPTGDNQWFADGIASELISAFSHIKTLRVADQQATKDFKRFTGLLPVYAHEMNIRYFVEGDVRKFGDQIKVTARLRDIETSDYLWQDSLKGTMQDIFDIQEQVAHNVVEGLKVILTSEEKQKIAERGTENAEAYEMFLKSLEYSSRHTREGFLLAEQLLSQAIMIDPGYAQAYTTKANFMALRYRSYDRDPKLLEEGLALIHEGKRLKPDLWYSNYPLSIFLRLQGKMEEAERTIREYILHAPEDFRSHFALGFFYDNIDQSEKSVVPYEEAQKLYPDSLTTLTNLARACWLAGQKQKQILWSEYSIPIIERRQRLFPDEEWTKVEYALLLYYAGRHDQAKTVAATLDVITDGRLLYNAAWVHLLLEDYASSVATFRKAMKAGFRDIQHLKAFLVDLAAIKGTPEWEAARETVEQIELDMATHG
ncbi:MAG TPA: TIR domain-containing protein [Candidatus Kapabacteria bacterium]